MPRSPEFQKKLDRALDVSKKLYRLVAARNEIKPKPSTPADKLPEVLWKDVPKGSRIESIELPPIKK